MSVRGYTLGFLVSSTLCWVAWILTVVNTNPEQSGQGALVSFYISLFFALLGSATLVGYAVRRYVTGNEVKYLAMRVAFRQAFLFAAFAVVLLLLQAARLASWWDILLLVLISFLLELYLRSHAATKHF